ncbi:MAG: hypothetical protein JWO36_655, partial [Myxococcales bacterium]|nr:hypothetical protein [Myxococcales bacterium]
MNDWAKSWLLAVASTAIILVSYERYCRQLGYVPSIAESADQWVNRWERSTDGPAVLLGNSRCLAALRPEYLAPLFGGHPPAQLCTVGINPLPVLAYLIDHTRFSGTVIVDIVPGSVFSRSGVGAWDEWRHRLEDRPVYAGLEQYFVATFQSRASSLIHPAAPLVWLRTLRGITPPWVVHQSEAVRADGAWIPVDDQEYEKKLWSTGVPWPEMVKADHENLWSDRELDQQLATTRRAVATLKARGGRVIFLRLPVSGTTKEAEDKYFPRAQYWDRWIEALGGTGIHFADYPSLQAFSQPDESHIELAMAPEFTRRLELILESV